MKTAQPKVGQLLKERDEHDDNVLHIKDEGDFFTTELLPDGSIPKANVLYEYGTLKQKVFYSKKEARTFAVSIGFRCEIF